MKNNIFIKLLGLAFIALFTVFVGCDKDDLVKLDAEMATWKNDGITSTSVLLSGIVVAEGEGISEYGVVWGLTENPTTADSKKVADKVEKAVYWITVDGLENLTIYNYRAYVVTVDGNTIYGENNTFKTLANIATITASDASGITDTFAQIAVNVPYDGKADVTSKGVCWNTEVTPTIENDTTLNGKGIGEFTADLTKLLPNTMYYARAYAVNSVGIAYSNEVSFTTTIGVPVLTTDSVRDITKTNANVYGNVIVTGGVDITERGFVYSMTENPTTADTKLMDAANTTGEMTAALSGLSSGKTYHIRAYAINSEGTAYGDNISFTTLSDITTWYIPGGYVEASYPDGYSNWTPESSPFVRNTDDNPTNLEGFVHMADDNSEWKFATDNTWSTNFGDDGANGSLEAGGANIVSPAGYYKINVDMSTTPMTYIAVSTDWGVIGDASPGGWDNDTDLSYDAATKTWRGTVHLAAGSFKFRANDDWDINYGSSAANETLNAGGDNIANAEEADYDITLDLSTPNTYTYTANRWGLIGDATPDGWDTDTDMTWDATNSVFTATLDLTAGGSYKFRANDGWDVNLGGALDGLTPGGDNLAITEDGNYTITLNTMTNVATVTKN